MKKLLVSVLLVQASILVGCGRNPAVTMPTQTGMPGATTPGYDQGAGGGYATTPGYGQGTGTGYGAGAGTGYNDPYGTGAGAGTGYNDPYGTGAGAGTGYNDPYGTGAGAGYGQGGYGQTPGYGQGGGFVDPATGQPMVDTGASQQIINQIQQAGGVKGSKSDNVVREALEGISIPQALGAAPLDHRSMIIKVLLDGWAGDDDRNFARQVWNTIMPQDQQMLLGQDAELNKLVSGKLLQGKGNGVSGVVSEVGKLFGIGS